MAQPAISAAAAVAAHRFGLGEPDLAALGADPRGWLLAQIGPADAARGDGLLDTARAVEHVRDEQRARREARREGCRQARGPLPRGDRGRRTLAAAHRRHHRPPVRRAAAAVLGQPLHRVAGQGQHARPGRRLRARRHPAAHRRQLRAAAVGRRRRTRRCCATWTTSCRPGRTRASSARVARRAAGDAGGPAHHRPEREPGARGARAAHAGRERRATRRPT